MKGKQQKTGAAGTARRRLALATAVTAIVASVVVSVGMAGRTQQTLTCNGEALTLTVTSTTNDHSTAWGVGTVSGGTHLIPTSFTGYLYDVTTSSVIPGTEFTQIKGNGHALQNQSGSLVACSETQVGGTAGDLGFSAPGVSSSDEIAFVINVTAIWKA
jgi:hypothetical protein